MENKKLLYITLLVLAFAPLFSQEKNISQPNSSVEEISEVLSSSNSSDIQNQTLEPMEEEIPVEEKWQILEWTEENTEYVLKYDVIIEQFNTETDEWNQVRELHTEDNSTSIKIEPQIQPGIYRFQVISYNLIGIADVASDWKSFTIYRAYNPAVREIQVKANFSKTMYLEEENDGIFNIQGLNLFTTKENETDINFTEYKLQSNKDSSIVILPEIISHNENNRELSLQFSLLELDVGTYNLIATDASGLKSSLNENSQIEVKFKKWLDIDVSGGYSLPITLFDDTFSTYLNSSVWPLSCIAKLSIIPFKHRYGYLGLGVIANYTRVSQKFDTYTIDGNIYYLHANLIYQLPIYWRAGEHKRHALTLEVHGGVGFVGLGDFAFHYETGVDSTPLNSSNLSILAGGAIQYYISNRLFVECNTDFSFAIMSDMQLGTLIPSILIGWQF